MSSSAEPSSQGQAATAPGGLICINPTCQRGIAPTARFCPFCATLQEASLPETPQVKSDQAQPSEAWGGMSGVGFTPGIGFSPGAYPRSDAGMASSPSEGTINDVLIFRAGENIWHFEEGERATRPGEVRPLLVVDEQVVHLAHTDKELTPDELLLRTERLIRLQKVPVEVRLVRAQWQNDRASETRPRIITSLSSHAYSDIKMVLGVDYLGRWASISMNLAIEPEPLPNLPGGPAKMSVKGPTGALVLGGISILFLGLGFMMYSSGNYAVTEFSSKVMVAAGFGFAAALYWFFMGITDAAARRDKEHDRQVAVWRAEQEQKALDRSRARLSRTFKVDDMRLFSSAMRHVFQQVVDDIVEQGATVERVEGGRGGFLGGDGSADGLIRPSAPPRRSDAAEAEV